MLKRIGSITDSPCWNAVAGGDNERHVVERPPATHNRPSPFGKGPVCLVFRRPPSQRVPRRLKDADPGQQLVEARANRQNRPVPRT